MAEQGEPNVDVTSKTLDESNDNEDPSFDFVSDIFTKVQDISTLVEKAKMKAKEAEIRAMYSLQFAERAIEEAKSAHVVSESLARTSHVVAMLALQITNDTDDFIDGNNLLEDSFTLSDAATQTLQTLGFDVENGIIKPPKTNQTATDSENPEEVRELESTSKFHAVYPHDLRTDDMKNEKKAMSHLPVLNEEDILKDIQLGNDKMEGDDKTDEVKRRMMLYKDSKLMKTNLRKSMEMGDADGLIYEEQGTQTC